MARPGWIVLALPVELEAVVGVAVESAVAAVQVIVAAAAPVVE